MGSLAYPKGKGVYPMGSLAYPKGRGVYPMGKGLYPMGKGVYPTGRGLYPMGSGIYPMGSHGYPTKSTLRAAREVCLSEKYYPAVFTQQRRTSATLQAWATQPRGV